MCRSLPTPGRPPRVESNADLHLHTMRATHLLAVAAQRLLHRQGGIAGAHGVVLMGERGAKERHDAIAHDLVDGAFIAMHRLHHVAGRGRAAAGPPGRGRPGVPSSP